MEFHRSKTWTLTSTGDRKLDVKELPRSRVEKYWRTGNNLTRATRWTELYRASKDNAVQISWGDGKLLRDDFSVRETDGKVISIRANCRGVVYRDVHASSRKFQARADKTFRYQLRAGLTRKLHGMVNRLLRLKIKNLLD